MLGLYQYRIISSNLTCASRAQKRFFGLFFILGFFFLTQQKVQMKKVIDAGSKAQDFTAYFFCDFSQPFLQGFNMSAVAIGSVPSMFKAKRKGDGWVFFTKVKVLPGNKTNCHFGSMSYGPLQLECGKGRGQKFITEYKIKKKTLLNFVKL